MISLREAAKGISQSEELYRSILYKNTGSHFKPTNQHFAKLNP